MQAGAQTIDTILHIHKTDSTVLNIPVTDIDSLTFSYDTVVPCNGLTSLTYNGYTYDLVEIGGQCWFKENLQTSTYRDGTPINHPGTDNTAWGFNTTGAYAWYDNDSITYASTYGALYNWYAVDNSAGLCPTGWHVPSFIAWNVLEGYLEANGYNYDGSTTGNKYAKAMADSIGWNPDTGVGTVGNTDYPTYRNKSDFSGLPSGIRDGSGSYKDIENKGYWWSSSQHSTSTYNAWSRYMLYSTSGLNYCSCGKEKGFSVRCLRD